MTRPRLLTAVVLAALVLASPAGSAVAEGDATPSPGPTTTLAADNQRPVANPDQATVEAGSSVVIPVLANDTDDGLPDDGDPSLRVVAVRSQTLDRFTFTPTEVTFDAGGADPGTFEAEYDVSDGELVGTAQIFVEVTAVPRRAVTIATADRLVALRTYPISGRVRPLSAGPATVRVQRRTPDGWVTHARDRTDVDGRYSVAFRTNKTGRRTFRAVASWSSGPRARSESITRRVRAVADAAVSGPLTAAQVPFSWRSGCPVPPSQLRKVHINRLNYRGRIARGVIVARAGEAGAIVKVLTAALNERFPIRLLRPADHYYDGGRRTPMESDKAAMRAGNTSAFNCRPVTGNPYRISQHSYGNAVDINTIENPYVTGSAVYPAGSREYLDRSPYRRGMILRGGVIADRMRALGWLWGARWSHPDYQHFSSNGG